MGARHGTPTPGWVRVRLGPRVYVQGVPGTSRQAILEEGPPSSVNNDDTGKPSWVSPKCFLTLPRQENQPRCEATRREALPS